MKTFSKLFFTLTLISSVSVSTFAQVKLAAPQHQNSKEKVSDIEVKQFAKAFQQIQSDNSGIQKDIANIIQEEGMELKRYLEIQKNMANPANNEHISKVEQIQLNKIDPKLEKLQEDSKLAMRKVIESSGLTSNRYNEIAAQLQNDTNLQMRVKALLKN